MKEFLVYTGLRVLLFIACFVVVAGIWGLLDSDDQIPVLGPLLVAVLLSGVASYFLLNRPREAFAQRVQGRADRAAAKFDEMRSKEDE
ncbi:DUF4229 domain-containing protein [Nocardioides speluncae]|uniref:DUF4229 domain-containing protein n=1 Tax=Nocardioides speluncae TaxID=2670337 RepID=UPI000D694A62|nr:DUF4229 domain-containing protein [Nocardioides speluncae]